jgi:hypothetical protein
MIYPDGVDTEANEVEHEMCGGLGSPDGDEREPFDVATAVGKCERELIMKHIHPLLKRAFLSYPVTDGGDCDEQK